MKKTELDLLMHQKDKDGIDYWSDETRQAMRELADQYEQERRQAMIEVGELPPDQPKGSISTTEVIDKFLNFKSAEHVSPATLKSYSIGLETFAKQYPQLPLEPEPIREFLASKSDITARGYYSKFKKLYEFAHEELGVPNVIKRVAKPRVKDREQGFLTEGQVKALLDAIITDRVRGLVYLYLGQALRLSEALRLNVADIGEDVISIEGKERQESMPLLPEVRDALLKLCNGRSGREPVFIGQRGRLSVSMVELDIKALFGRADVNGVKQSPHTFRHTFATLAGKAGLDDYWISRLLRHSTKGRGNATRGYRHHDIDDLRQRLEIYSPIRLLSEAGLRKFRKCFPIALNKVERRETEDK